jgi:hypothetical protein
MTIWCILIWIPEFMSLNHRCVLKEQIVQEIGIFRPVHLMTETHSEPLSSFGMLGSVGSPETFLFKA